MAYRKVEPIVTPKVIENELQTLLLAEPDHKIEFDVSIGVFSKRYNCLLMAKNVHLDSVTGKMVVVGAFRSGDVVYDESRGYKVMRKEIELPFLEAYYDMESNLKNGDKLLEKVRKAFIDKYFVSYADRLYVRGFFDESGLMAFRELGRPVARHLDNHCREVFRNIDGSYHIISGNDFNRRYFVDFSKFTITQLLDFTSEVRKLYEEYSAAVDFFISRKGALGGCDNRTYSDREMDEINSRALVELYRSGRFSLPVVSSVARGLCGIGDFDFRKYSAGSVEAMVSSYSGEGRISQTCAASHNSERGVSYGRGV